MTPDIDTEGGREGEIAWLRCVSLFKMCCINHMSLPEVTSGGSPLDSSLARTGLVGGEWIYLAVGSLERQPYFM